MEFDAVLDLSLLDESGDGRGIRGRASSSQASKGSATDFYRSTRTHSHPHQVVGPSSSVVRCMRIRILPSRCSAKLMTRTRHYSIVGVDTAYFDALKHSAFVVEEYSVQHGWLTVEYLFAVIVELDLRRTVSEKSIERFWKLSGHLSSAEVVSMS